MSKGIIHSGGAKGADEFFGNFGCLYGYKVIHHSFKGHQTYGDGVVVRHTLKELQETDELLLKVSGILKRDYPPEDQDIRRRLQRDYFQVIHSEYIVAVAPFENDEKTIVTEGTGWTVGLARMMNKTIYLFDDGKTNKWYISESGSHFTPFEGIIPNTGSFAGIGSQTISETGKNEIKKILQYSNNMTEILKYIFDKISDDLKFAEAKNIFIMTFSAALTGGVATILKLYDKNHSEFAFIMITCFAIGCIVSLYASIPSNLNCNMKTNQLHWMGIAEKCCNTNRPEKYVEQLGEKYILLPDEMNKDIAQKILVIAKIAQRKFNCFKVTAVIIIIGIIAGLILIFKELIAKY